MASDRGLYAWACRLLGAAFLSSAICGGAGAAQITGSNFQVGVWSGAAYNSDSGGFSHCAVSARYQDNTILIFALSPSRWTLGLANGNWQLKDGSQYPVQYYVDSDPPHQATATAVGTDQVSIELPEDQALYNRMRLGTRLYVKTNSNLMNFGLAGTGAALNALGNCLNSYQKASTSNPFGGTSAPAAQQAATASSAKPVPGSKGEMTKVVDAIMKNAGLKFEYIDPDEFPDVIGPDQVGWWIGDGMGTIDIVSSGADADPAKYMQDQKQYDQKDCKAGTFSAQGIADPHGTSDGIARLFASCKMPKAKDSWADYNLVFRRPQGGVYAIVTTFWQDFAPGQDVDVKLREAVYRLYGE
jgi:hypothetical protein